MVELYANDEAGFLKQKGRVQRVRVSASAPVTNACLGAPAAGAYAVVLYHDENSDQKFNRTIFGMPSEGFGLSNNVRPRLSAPSLESVLIQAPEGEIPIRVQMRYMVGPRGCGAAIGRGTAPGWRGAPVRRRTGRGDPQSVQPPQPYVG